MKKIFMSALLLVMLVSVSHAYTQIEFNIYRCKICGKNFRSFRGDELDDRKFQNADQLKYIFQFWKYDKNFPECRNGVKWHNFEKKNTSSMLASGLTSSGTSEYVAAVKDGRTLSGVKLTEWECVYCGKKFYSLNGENLNIRDWEQEADKIHNLKGRSISKCPEPKVYGHIFARKRTIDAKSYDLARNAENIYWVKD